MTSSTLLIHSRHGVHSHSACVPCDHVCDHVQAGPPSCRSSILWSCIHSHVPCDGDGDQARHQPPSCRSSILWFCIHSPSSFHVHDDDQAQPLSFHRIQDRIHHILHIHSQVRIHHSHSQDHSQGHSHSSLHSRHQHRPQHWPQQQRWPQARPPSCHSSIPWSCSHGPCAHDGGDCGQAQPEQHRPGGQQRQRRVS